MANLPRAKLLFNKENGTITNHNKALSCPVCKKSIYDQGDLVLGELPVEQEHLDDGGLAVIFGDYFYEFCDTNCRQIFKINPLEYV